MGTRLWIVIFASLSWLPLVLVAACSESLPGPTAAPQPIEAFVEVPYPPPAGRVEYVPPRPRKGASWIDGQWRWETDHWRWDHGGWYLVPAGVGFARWETRRTPDGRLIFAPGTWRDEGGREAPAPTILARAAAGPLPSEFDAGMRVDASLDAEFDAPSMFDGDLFEAGPP